MEIVNYVCMMVLFVLETWDVEPIASAATSEYQTHCLISDLFISLSDMLRSVHDQLLSPTMVLEENDLMIQQAQTRSSRKTYRPTCSTSRTKLNEIALTK